MEQNDNNSNVGDDGSNAGVCDFTLDGIPEFISIVEKKSGQINSMVFEYKNG